MLLCSFLAELPHQEVLNRGCCVKLACCKVEGLSREAFATCSDAVTCKSFLPSWQYCVQRCSLHPHWFVWRICKNSCEANQLYCKPSWGLSLLQLESLANQFVTCRSANFIPWDEHGAVWYTYSFFYLVLIFHILLYLTWKCLPFSFCQSIENFRKCCILKWGWGRENGGGRGCTKIYKAINYYLHFKQTLVWI